MKGEDLIEIRGIDGEVSHINLNTIVYVDSFVIGKIGDLNVWKHRYYPYHSYFIDMYFVEVMTVCPYPLYDMNNAEVKAYYLEDYREKYEKFAKSGRISPIKHPTKEEVEAMKRKGWIKAELLDGNMLHINLSQIFYIKSAVVDEIDGQKIYKHSYYLFYGDDRERTLDIFTTTPSPFADLKDALEEDLSHPYRDTYYYYKYGKEG